MRVHEKGGSLTTLLIAVYSYVSNEKRFMYPVELFYRDKHLSLFLRIRSPSRRHFHPTPSLSKSFQRACADDVFDAKSSFFCMYIMAPKHLNAYISQLITSSSLNNEINLILLASHILWSSCLSTIATTRFTT